MKDMMMNKGGVSDDMASHEEEEKEETTTGPSEEYIQRATSSMGNLIPEDFLPLSVSLPTDAEDGETVAMLITGTAQGGKLGNVQGAKLDLKESKPKGKLRQAFNREDEGSEEEQ